MSRVLFMLIVHLYARWCSTRFSFQIMLLTVTRRVSHLEQELLTLPENLSSPPLYSGVRFNRSFPCRLFNFVLLLHLANVLPALRFTISDYHFAIFKLFVSGTIEQVKYINARIFSRNHEQLNTQMYIWCSET